MNKISHLTSKEKIKHNNIIKWQRTNAIADTRLWHTSEKFNTCCFMWQLSLINLTKVYISLFFKQHDKKMSYIYESGFVI